nr:hypothetical protein [Tanacetum cinerariifolium]
MHKAFPLTVIEFPLPEEVPIEVIEFRDSYVAPANVATTGSTSDGTGKKKGMTVTLTTDDMQKRKNDQNTAGEMKKLTLLGEVPTASEESSHWQKKREATAVKIALLLQSRRICTTSDRTSKKKGRIVTLTTEDMQKRKNDVKARTTLLLSLPDEHQLRFSKYKTAQELWAAILKTLGGNEATKKTKKNLLKQQYGNFKAEGSETLEQTFNRLQTGLPEFKDDTVTDYSRPSPAIKSTSDDAQNRNPSEVSPSTISPKPFIKFVKANDSPTKSKTDKVEIAKKPPVKYAEQYRKPTKKPNEKKSKELEQSEIRSIRKFPTGNTKFSTADMGNKEKAGSSQNNIDDKGYWDSGCSRHMTGNISYLSDYEPFDEGYVSFDQGGCKITGKGTIKTGKLEFENVYFVKDLNHKWYCLVVTDDFSRFTWTFFLKTKDETSGILRKFITEIKKIKDLKVKIIRTPQQNGVAERRDRTLIEAARIMLADAKLLVIFWAESVNTACYVQNRVFVNKSYNKTPYELFNGRSTAIGFLKPFGCHVMILNTLDHLGKFKAKGDEGYFIGYSMSSKALRVFIKRTKRVEESLHVEFLENKAIEKDAGPNWLFDINSLTKSMNYVPVVAGINSNNLSGTKDVASQEVKKDVSSLRYIALPN